MLAQGDEICTIVRLEDNGINMPPGPQNWNRSTFAVALKRGKLGLSIAILAIGLSAATRCARAEQEKFIIGRFHLGQTLNLDADLNGGAHRCQSSSDFAGFTWCYVHNDEIGNSGPFKSDISILINSNNKVVFVTQSVVPAFFHAGDVEREVKRISRGFGLEARFESAEPRPGVPHAVFAAWGDVTLTPLDASAIELVQRGHEPHRGLIADFIGDPRRSARIDLPVYTIGGGSGFIWAAHFDESGRGSLQITCVDASLLATATGNYNSNVFVPSPIVSPNSPTLTINNNTCKYITEVTIDGTRQVNGIGPGKTANFHMNYSCFHAVEGNSLGANWKSNISCQGVPYDNYTVNWVPGNQQQNPEELTGENLIVDSKFNAYYSYGTLYITSKADCIEIDSVDVNRGNCRGSSNLPKALRFGDTLQVTYFCEKLLEINVHTDQGVGTFSFN